MKISVKHYEEIDEHEFTTLYNGQHVLARDVETRLVPTMTDGGKGKKTVYKNREIKVWNKKPRDIKRINGKYYLVTAL